MNFAAKCVSFIDNDKLTANHAVLSPSHFNVVSHYHTRINQLEMRGKARRHACDVMKKTKYGRLRNFALSMHKLAS